MSWHRRDSDPFRGLQLAIAELLILGGEIHQHDGLPAHLHPSHDHQHQRRITFMADIEVGASVTRTATAELPNPDGSGTFIPDPNSPTITYTEDSGGTFATLVDNGSSASGVSSYTLTGVSVGTVNVTCTSVDPDGNTVSGVDAHNVVAAPAPPATNDATQIAFS